MDYIFNQLTDIGLRRLYKFILKRTIGKYLQDELLIDQLHVISRDGIVKLTGIKFNAEVLNNEFFGNLAFKLVSLTVDELKVHLSYKTLLTDSCRFVVDNVEAVFQPNETLSKPKADNSNFNDRNTEIIDENEVSVGVYEEDYTYSSSEDGQKGLSFIAHWIEVIVARLQVSVNNINIIFRPLAAVVTNKLSGDKHRRQHRNQVTKDNYDTNIQLRISNIQYYNDDPNIFNMNDSSIALSTRLANSTLKSSSIGGAAQLGNRKVMY